MERKGDCEKLWGEWWVIPTSALMGRLKRREALTWIAFDLILKPHASKYNSELLL
jgi:hypothetical protein